MSIPELSVAVIAPSSSRSTVLCHMITRSSPSFVTTAFS
jgi:hypothetical protein